MIFINVLYTKIFTCNFSKSLKPFFENLKMSRFCDHVHQRSYYLKKKSIIM